MGAISCGATCIKYILFAFNLIFVVLGAVLIYAGVRVIGHFGQDWSAVIKTSTPNGGAIALIALGVFVFIISFLGCCGAIKQSYCMLNLYSGAILLLLIAEIVGAVFVLKQKGEVEGLVKEYMQQVMKTYNKANPKDQNSFPINKFQESYKCCGVANSSDWNTIPDDPNKFPKDLLPYSCCENVDISKMNCDLKTPGIVVYKPCAEKLQNEIQKSGVMAGAIAIALACIQLLIIVSACCLAREIKNN